MCCSVGGRWRVWSSLWPPWGLQTMPSALNKQNSPQNLLGVFCCSHKNSPPQSSGILEIRPAEEGAAWLRPAEARSPRCREPAWETCPFQWHSAPAQALHIYFF